MMIAVIGLIMAYTCMEKEFQFPPISAKMLRQRIYGYGNKISPRDKTTTGICMTETQAEKEAAHWEAYERIRQKPKPPIRREFESYRPKELKR